MNIDDVWMVYFAQSRVLFLENPDITDLELMYHFDGISFLGQPVSGGINYSKATLTHFFVEEILCLDIPLACSNQHLLVDLDVFRYPLVDNCFL